MTATALTSQSGTCGPGGEGSLLIGVSPHVRALRLLIPRLARWPWHASVIGPTGVGKALFAQEVFRHLPAGTAHQRRSVATEHDDLVEGHWRGWVKGAYTDAKSANPGVLGAAADGVVFLDEVQLLHTQPKLRRLLLDAADGADLFQLGGTRPYRFLGRFLLGSHRPLSELHAEGIMPEDLYERLSGPEVRLEPLASRREDIPLLAEHFLREIAGAVGLVEAGISSAAMDALLAYEWPRNIRQLRNVVRNAVWASGVEAGEGLLVQPWHLGPGVLGRAAGRRGSRPKVSLDTVRAAVRRTGSTRSAAQELGLSQRTVQRRSRGSAEAREQPSPRSPEAAAGAQSPYSHRPPADPLGLGVLL